MATKYYAVKKGKKPGIYKTWNDCKLQVVGYSGAVYKSFPSMEDAKKFMEGASASKKKVIDKNNVSSDMTNSDGITTNKDLDKIIAYVDGSYNNSMKVYSGGSVILYQGKTYELSKVGNDKALVDMRNVAGELLGVKNVINWIIDKELKNVVVEIHYDYEGIERWANYEWKANKDGTKDYQKFVDNFRALGHEVFFVKEKAHSGVFYNEEADRLAGEAISKYQLTGQMINNEESKFKETYSQKPNENTAEINSEKSNYDDTIKIDSEYRLLFEKVFDKEIDEKNKFKITYGKYDLSEKDIIKFIKSTWKSKGYLIKDINDIMVVLDVQYQTIKWLITDSKGKTMSDEFKM